MIRKLEVKGLNNRVDGAWEFNEDLNIITGRNGSGKTTLLKLIWYLISGNIEQIISDIPLQSVAIETDSFSLSIQVKSDKCKLHCESANEDNQSMNCDILLQIENIGAENIKRIHRLRQQIAQTMYGSLFFPSFRRIEGGFTRISGYTPYSNLTIQESIHSENAEAAILQEPISQFSNEFSASNHKLIASISTHDIVELLTEKHADASKKMDESYANLSKEIKQKISKINPLEEPPPVWAGIQDQIAEVANEQKSLFRTFGVLGKQIRDILHYEGIRVTEEITLGEQEEAIKSDKLSAGEKQMLSFLCYNTFSENTAIFIDEPELSLHVDWQRLLLPTLLEQETGNQFFVATHSPFIYAKYPDKEILLGEDRGGD